MKLSMKTDYALRVLFTLVEHYGEGPIPIRELARRNNVPKRFLEHIMLDLKEEGWARSVAGNRGGYLLAKKPEKISMGEVVRHFDGVLAPIGCVSITHYERCPQEAVCRFRKTLLEIRNATARIMDRTTLSAAFPGRPVRRKATAAAKDPGPRTADRGNQRKTSNKIVYKDRPGKAAEKASPTARPRNTVPDKRRRK